jgi:hypothetical protein
VASDPSLLERIRNKAKQRSAESLGLAQLYAELDAIHEQSRQLEERETNVKRSMLAIVRGESADDLSRHDVYRWDTEVHAAIKRRQSLHEDELLAESETGRRILELRQERENLLDTVWLATSSTQIRTLWTQLGELLDDEQTQLRKRSQRHRVAATYPSTQNRRTNANKGQHWPLEEERLARLRLPRSQLPRRAGTRRTDPRRRPEPVPTACRTSLRRLPIRRGR